MNIGNIDIVNLHISHITTQRIKVEFPIFAVSVPKCRDVFNIDCDFYVNTDKRETEESSFTHC